MSKIDLVNFRENLNLEHMYPIKRVMVGLDLTEIDEQLISYLNFLNTIYEFDSIYFIHVAKTLKLPDKIREKYPDVLAPIDESLTTDIRKKIDSVFTQTGTTRIHVQVREGDPEEEIMNWTGIKEIDLLVMGRKLDLEGEGRLPNRMSRMIHCSVLIVPEGIRNRMKNILIPVDFSDTCVLAMDEARFLKEHSGASVMLEHSFEVPSGYHKSGKSYEEFSRIMEKNAMDDMRGFLKKTKFSEKEVKVFLSFDEEDDPAERAYEVAAREQADLIITASRGRTNIASMILGSFAEKMIQYDSDIPLLVVKNKKENLNFFQALLKI